MSRFTDLFQPKPAPTPAPEALVVTEKKIATESDKSDKVVEIGKWRIGGK